MRKITCLSIGIISLLLVSCTLQKANSAGRINGTDIPYPEFMDAHKGHFNNFMAEKGRTPDSEEKKEILKQTWRNITIHVILKSHFKKHNIKVSPQEVLDTLMTNIPDYLLSSPLLMTNGRFDRSLYLQSLEFDTPVNLGPIKRHYFEYLIPIQKLKIKLIDTQMLSRSELKLMQDIYQSVADVSWVIFDPQNFRVNISDAEIQAFYQANLAKFAMENSLSLDYALIPVSPSFMDYSDTKNRVDSLYTALVKGSEFAPLAEKFSVSESSIRGGNLGYLRNDEIPSHILKRISELSTPAIAEPFEHDDVWYIYQVKERTKNMVRLNEIAIKPRAGLGTIESSFPKVRSLIELSKEIGLQEATDEMDYSFYSTGKMLRDSLWIRDLDAVNTFKEQLKKAKQGEILDPFFSHKLGSWIVVQVSNNQTRKYRSLADVKEEIIGILNTEKRLDHTFKIAEQWISRTPQSSLDKVDTSNMTIIRNDKQKITDLLFEIPAETLFYRSIKSYRENKVIPHIHAEKVLVPWIHSVHQDKSLPIKHDLIRSLYMNSLPDDWFDKWLNEQIETASVKIWQ